MQKFLRTLTLVALLAVPWVAQGQVAKVSEYDFEADTVVYTTIVGNGGTAWSATDRENGYATVTMQFGMQFGQTSIRRGATLYVSPQGYVTTDDASMSGIVIAPLGTPAGFSGIGANTIYTKMESNRLTIEWRKLKIDDNHIVSFQLVLTNTGVIRFQYGPMTLGGVGAVQVFAGMQSSASDVYCLGTANNRWDTIVPAYTQLDAPRSLSAAAHPYYDLASNSGLRYSFTQPECAKPNSFGAVPGDFNVIFNWTGNGSKYQIKYHQGENFAPMTEGTLIDNLTGTSYTLSNLTQRTTYYAYIRAYCSTSSSWSAWRAIDGDAFSTGCGYEPIAAPDYYSEDFAEEPQCWDYLKSNAEATGNTVWVNSSYNRLQMRAGNESNGYSNDVYAVLPKFNVGLNSYELDLNAYVESPSYGKLILGYITNVNNLASFTVLDTLEGLTTSAQDIVLYLTDYANIPSTARLALKWSNDYSYYDCYINSIGLKPQPTCFPISGLQVSEVTSTSAKFSFTDGHTTSTAYQLVLGAPGFDPDGATPVAITNGGTVTTLEGSTNYQAYVRAICGTEQLVWVGPVAFSTPCPSMTVTAANPFREQFDANDVPNCWSMQGYTSSSWFFDDGAAYGSSSSCSSGCEAWLYSPVFSFGTGDILLSFRYYQAAWGSDQNYLTVYYRTSSTDEWHQLVQYTNSISSWTSEEMTLPSTSGATEYQLAFTSTNNYGHAVYLDDIKIRPAPTCMSPSDLAVSVSKVLTWTAGDATQWQVRYGVTGSGSYTTMVVNAATATLPLTGEAGTQYEISVRSICGVGDTNEWVEPVSYTMPLSLPYSCDFEDGATGFVTQSTASNVWVVGTAASNGGSNGYYVSNDGTSNAYSHGNNIAYAYVTLPFENVGDYIIKYDWTANGESTWDFLRVALVPDNASLPTSYVHDYYQDSYLPTEWIPVDGGYKNLNTSWNTYVGSVNITTPGNYKLVFAWMNDGSGGSQPPAAIDNVSVRGLNCNNPSNIALNASGAVEWTPGNTTQWQVRWAEQGSSNYTSAVVSTPSYASSTWAPNTSYTIDIRSICGANDTLDWVTFDFTMPCTAMDITAEPFYEDFESYSSGWGNTPKCWNFLNQSSSSSTYPQAYTYTSSAYAVSGKCLYFKSSSSTPIYVALPRFTSNINSLQMEFYYRNEGTSDYNGTLSLGVMTNPNDASTYTNIETFDRTTTITKKNHIFSNDGLTGNGYYIVFKYEGSYNNYYLGIDNVTVEVIPTCPKATGLADSNVTSASADLAWTNNAASDPEQWEIRYNNQTTTSTTNSVSLSDLTANTLYEVSVRAICTAANDGTGDTSAWSETYTFRTGCGATQALPYAEDFSGYTGLATNPYTGPSVSPACWDYSSNGTNTAETTGSSYYGGVGVTTGTSYGSMVANNPYLCMPIYVIGSNVTGTSYINNHNNYGDTKYAVMPLFNQPLSNLMVSFDYKMSSNNSATGGYSTLELGYITDDDTSTFQSLLSYDGVNSKQSVVEQTLATLAASAPANARLAFRYSGGHNGTSSYSYTTLYCGIDNIVVRVIPNCFPPMVSTFAATNVAATSATVSWTDRNTTNPGNWEVKYSTDANFDPTTEGTATAVTSASINLTGLTDDANYYVFVRALCGGGDDSEWSDAFTFRTTCLPYTVTMAEPYVYGFEDAAGSGASYGLNSCWAKGTNSTTAYPYPYSSYVSSNTNPLTPTNNYCLYMYGTTTYYSYAVLPTFSNDLTDLQLSLKVYKSSTTATYGVVQVGVMTDPSDISTFQLVQQVQPSSTNTWTTFEIALNNFTGTPGRLAIMAPAEGTNYVYVDDIEVSLLPPCVKPSDVHTTALAYNAATIDWTQNTTKSTEGSWEVMFGPSPLDTTTAAVTTLTDHVFNAANLDEQTTYDFYVRANCSADGYSEWSNVFTFTTPCMPITVTKYDPYVYGFEDATGSGSTSNISLCWNKGVVGSTTAYPYPYSSYVYYNTDPITPTNNYHLYMYGSATVTSYAVLPEFTNPVNTLQLSLKVMKTGTSTYYGKVIVGVMADPSDLSTFTPIDTVQPSSTYSYTTFSNIYFDTYTGAYGRIAFRTTNEGSDYAYVDDIEVSLIPTCRPATNLASEQVYAKTATLSWTENSPATPAKWEVRYAPTTVDLDDEEALSVFPTTDNVVLTNLVPETEYHWNVRAICVAAQFDGDTAAWSSQPQTFTTTATCVVPVLEAPVATANSVTLNWTEKTLPVAATRWEVAIGPKGFNPNREGTHNVTNRHSDVVIDGLKHSTNYEVYVRSLCSDEDQSNWSTVHAFSTQCAPWQYEDMPLVETLTGSLPNCWTKAGGSYSSGDIYGTGSMIILPEMGFALDTIEMTFEAANYYSDRNGDFQVGYLTSKEDTSTFTAVQTITLNSTSYSEYQVSFAGIDNTTARFIAVRGTYDGSNWTDFYLRNVKVNVREPIIWLPSEETAEYCGVFYHADTIGHEETYAGNLNMVQTVYPAEAGKVVHLTGTMDCEYGYDYLTIYEGVGTNGAVLYHGTGYDNQIDVKTDSSDATLYGPLTIVFTTDVDNTDKPEGFKLYAQCECPTMAPQLDEVIVSKVPYTWRNGRTYSNNVTVANQQPKTFEDEYREMNGECPVRDYTLNLTVYPTYTLTDNKELCQRQTLEFYDTVLATTGVYTRSDTTVYGSDSTTTLTLNVHPAPTAYIYVNGERTEGSLEAFCDMTDLVMTARATIAGSAFAWDDNSHAAERTVQPHEADTFTVVAYDPTYNCPSLPVELTVTTTPVPALSIAVDNEVICAGGTATLTVSDANNTECTYRWSNGQTGASITVNPTATTEYTVTATTPNASACVATAAATITVNALPVVEISPSATEICRYQSLTLNATEKTGYSYSWSNGMEGAEVSFEMTNSGKYDLTVFDANGCENTFSSPVVTVRPAYNINDTMSICAAMLPYTWGSQVLNDAEGGDYDQTWPIAYGCDSTVHMHLDVTATGVANNYATYCEGTAFDFGQGQYKTSHVASLDTTMLSYIDTTSEVCPVQYNLILTVNPVKATSFEADSCDRYTWNGTVYTTAGSHEQTLQTINGCDSVVTMNLTLRATTTGVDSLTVCDKLEWIDGNIYTESNNTAQHTIVNAAGCDSIVTLNLTVNYANTGVESVRWCSTPTYTWTNGNGRTYDMSETDGTVRYLLPDQKNQYGCDSTVILNLVLYLPTDTVIVADTSACDMLIVDTVACDGNLQEWQITQSGDYDFKVPTGNGNYQVQRRHVTINSSDYHTTVKRNVCLPYEWLDADDNLIAVITDIYTSRDTNISMSVSTAGGCERTEVLRLINTKPQTYQNVDTAICLGETYSGYGHSVTPGEAGNETYTWKLGIQNQYGCDSNVRVALTVNPTVEDVLPLVLCENNFAYNEGDGLFHYTYVNEADTSEKAELTYASLNGQPHSDVTVVNWATDNGCNRQVTFEWTVNPNTDSTIYDAARYTYTWKLNDATFDNMGEHADTVVVGENSYGCDSIVYLHLTLYDTVYTVIDTTVCTSYKGPDGKIYHENMTFTETLKEASQYGTDSVVITNFFVQQHDLTDVYVASTDAYTWVDGVEYSADAEAYFTMESANKCDSTLHLFFTKLDTIVLCSEALPFETRYGFTIDSGSVSATYQNHDARHNDTIVSYVINMPTHNVDVVEDCERYAWETNGMLYTESGVYTYAYNNEKGCASVDTLKLTLNFKGDTAYTVTACDSYEWHDSTYTVSTTAYHSYETAAGCASVDTLYLTVNHNASKGESVVACETYEWHDSTYVASGDYTYSYTTEDGCASVDTLHLTIGHPDRNVAVVDQCDSYTWTVNGTTYTASIVDSVVYQNRFTCDSTWVLDLTIRHSTDSTVKDTACDTFVWALNGETYTESGNYLDTIENVAGCDSVITLSLTVKNNTNTVFIETVCDSIRWNGTKYTESGEYSFEYLAENGCPSADTLKLTVNSSKSVNDTTISSVGFYEFHMVANDVTYDTLFQSNASQWFGPLTATFTSAAGCDSVVNYYFLVGTTRNKTEVVVECQEYTWPRNGVTYVYMSEAERAAANDALYKTSTGEFIYEAPIATVSSNNAIDSTFVLALVLTERYTASADTTFLLSNETLALGDSIFDFSAEKAARFDGFVHRSVHYTDPHSMYCDSLINYNIHLIYNYDTTVVDICADQTEYQWGSYTIATATPGSKYERDSIGADGWLRHLVVKQAPVYAGIDTKEACDSYTWLDGETYTADNSTAEHVIHGYKGCDSTVTLNLTIKHSTTGTDNQVACDTYTWPLNGSVYTSNNTTDTVHLTNAAGCDSIVTLNLAIKHSTEGVFAAVACDTYTWAEKQNKVYTESNSTDTIMLKNAAGCDSTVTLNLTINNSNSGVFTAVACDSYTWVAKQNKVYTESNSTDTIMLKNGAGCDSTVTLNLTINASTEGIDEVTACDSLTWKDGITYYTANTTAQYTGENEAGCHHTWTLNLTVNHATHNKETKSECDNYVWNGQNYAYEADKAYPDTIYYRYVNNVNCPSVDTLFLTLHQSSAETFVDTACESFTWVNNGATITKTESGTYTNNYTNADGCPSTDLLLLTIKHNSVGSTDIVSNNGYYTYNNVLYTADRSEGDYFDTTFYGVASGLNAVGCDSTTDVHLLVGTTAIGMDNQVWCNSYTWINGHTYTYDTTDGALYYDSTDHVLVFERPRYKLPETTSVNGFDTISILNLTLTQVKYYDQDVRFLLSQGVCYLTKDSAAAFSVDFRDAEAGTRDITLSHGATSRYCDSIVTYHITLVNNYTEVGTDGVCATREEYTWDNTNIMGGHNLTYDLTDMITDFDHESTVTLYDTVFKGDANNEWVYAKTLTVHPLIYTTEHRVACDSLRWNGTLFTESDSKATRFFPNGSSFGCDSTVTLNLTIKKNSSTGYTPAPQCDEYTWALNNETYTESGTYYRAYTANGCPSVDTLYLTVNYKSDSVLTWTACDSYTWNGETYTSSTEKVVENLHTVGGNCDSTATLHLTINTHSDSVWTAAACDSYTWAGISFTESGDYVIDTNAAGESLKNAAGCDSTATLHLTINKNNGKDDVADVCDSMLWAVNGVTYYESGEYTYDSTDANGCHALCTLNLTVRQATHNAETAVACRSYEWNNHEYTASGNHLFSYTNEAGCPSVDTLHLTINSQTTYFTQTVENCGPYTWVVNDSTIGVFENSIETSTSFTNPRTMCDSMVFLRLTVYEAPHAYESDVICADALPYTWRGLTLTASCDTAITTAFTEQCDSTIHFALTVNALDTVRLTDGICLGLAYNANGFELDAADLTAGTHVFSHTVPSTTTGCDSTTVLTLTVGDVIYTDTVKMIACDSYDWAAGDGQTYNYAVTGVYNSSAYANAQGCTSIDVLALTINNNSSTGYTETACGSYEWNGMVLTASCDTTFSYTAENGCPSVDTLHLTVNYNTNSTQTSVVCDSYEWNGMTLTASCDTVYRYTAANGCASVDTLHLTVNYNSNSAETAVACDSYEWNGMTLTASCDTVYRYNAENGCASVDTLYLTVKNNSNAAYTEVVCDNYTWNGMFLTESCDTVFHYTANNGCPSADTLHLTVNYNSSSDTTVVACDSFEWHGQTYTSTGVYRYSYNTEAGCPSTDVLHLAVKYNTNASFTETACDSYSWNGMTLTESCDTVFHYTANNGCPSVDTLHLTVNVNTNSGSSAEVCDSYEWHGNEYTTSDTYYYNYTTNEGCASVDTLYLTVKHNSNKQRTIIACDEYTWNGETYYASGDYLFEYEANNGCPSVDTLHLTVNYNTSARFDVVTCGSYEWNNTTYDASGVYTFDYVAENNCESTDTLNLTLSQAAQGTDVRSACEEFTWIDGVTYIASTNEPTFTLTSASGCDSIVTLNLTILQPVTATVNESACGFFNWHGETYTESGTATWTGTAANGCDSIVTLNVTINNAVSNAVNVSNCGDYEWNGTTYTASGSYIQHLETANGCDSTVTLTLTITHPQTVTLAPVTACDSYTWTNGDGETYTTSQTLTHTVTGSNGCDSTTTLALTVNNSQTVTLAPVSACGSYTWNGVTYTESQTLTHLTTGSNGCDSTTTVVLTVNNATYGDTSAVACDNFVWNGVAYNLSGDYQNADAYTNVNGCDSIVTLHLTINRSIDVTVDETVCDSYVWDVDGQTYTTSGIYTSDVMQTIHGCDSTVTLNLTVNHSSHFAYDATAVGSYLWNGEELTESGVYTWTGVNAEGCDSVVTLTLTVTPAYFTVTIGVSDSTMGNVTNGGTRVYAVGDVVTSTASPNVGYHFVRWSNGSTDATISVVIASDTTLTAEFAIDIYTIEAVSSDITMGEVTGSGEYEYGATVTLEATAKPGYRFVRWSTGDTEAHLEFTAVENLTVTAFFESVGIEDVVDSEVEIYSTDNRIVVKGAEHQDVYVYDVNGRCVRRQANATETIEFTMSTSGVYLVKVGKMPAKRVVVVR